MDGKAFRELISGKRRGISASMTRLLLECAELPYTAIVGIRNLAYDYPLGLTTFPAVPAISVGNMTLGGTGKTPLVAWIAERLSGRGLHVGLISRGYGGKTTENIGDGTACWHSLNDEGKELALRLPNVPHLQNADRIAAARALLENSRIDCLILDDAFQHRRIGRNLDIVLIDALEPFGFDHVFPRGTLREPLAGLKRADIVLLSRADQVDGDERRRIRKYVRRFAPEAHWGEIVHRPECLLGLVANPTSPSGNPCSSNTLREPFLQEPLENLRETTVFAFCGIGNPDGFRRTLESCGTRIAAFQTYPDHHRFTDADMRELVRAAEHAGAEIIVCTVKDAVKIMRDRLGPLPLRAVSIGIGFLEGEEETCRQMDIL